MTVAAPATEGSAAGAASAILRAEGLSKSFGGVRALRDVSLTVRKREIFAVIGPNGAGKSTLLNLLSGIYPADAGVMVFDGTPLTALAAHQRVRHGIARTFQKIRLFKHLSALDNVVAGFHIHCDIPGWQYIAHGAAFRRHHARCQEQAAELLAFVGLAQRAHVMAGSLAYGEQRMLEIARSLATAPRLLMIDEPAAGLNAAEVDALLERIEQLRGKGVTVLVVEHNMDLVMNVADRVLVLDSGRFVFEGTPAEVQVHPAVIEAYLGGEVR
jgi:branched-chain amino acid transport system ATP-binding protein